MNSLEKFGWLHFISAFCFFLVVPAFALVGGSIDLINWGPGILMSGIAAVLLAVGTNRDGNAVSDIHGWLWVSFLALLLWRALISSGVPLSSVAGDVSLIALAVIAYFIGKSTGGQLSCALMAGLAAVVLLNLACILVQTFDVDWNLIYSQRSGGFPSGLFAHYNSCASFSLGAMGLLVSRSCTGSGWFKWWMIIGAFCAFISIPLTLSRGGNLALAVVVIISIALLLARGFRSSKSFLNVWIPALVSLLATAIAFKYIIPMLNRSQVSFYQDGGRIGFYQAALDLADQSPWTGGGANSFSLNVLRVMENLECEPDKIHNEALQLVVDYGYPSLVAMALLIAVPVFWRIWRFSIGADVERKVWECVGLIGMLVQSNFCFIFHVAPCVLLAGIILGRISYRTRSEKGVLPKSAGVTPGEDPVGYRKFITISKNYCNEYLSGKSEAAVNLTSHFSGKDEPWHRYRSRIMFHTRTGNPARLENVVKEIREQCVSDLLELSGLHESQPSNSGLRKARKVCVFAAALCMVLLGGNLSQALVEAWPTSYGRGETLANWQRFEKLISFKEKYPHAAIDRSLLSSALDCIYQFETAVAREYWAEGHRRRLEDAVFGATSDPVVALQLACILGWAGDVDAAFELYDQAIAAQGKNETLFMANAYKGQYHHELSVSASEAGQEESMKDHAKSAVASFMCSKNSLKAAPWKFSSNFSKALIDCQAVVSR